MGRDAQHYYRSRHSAANVFGWRRVRREATIQPLDGKSDDFGPERRASCSLGLGWALSGSHSWNAFGDLVSGEAFGHAGASGTMVWADPETQVLCVILTNRPYSVDGGQFLRLVSNAVAASVHQVPVLRQNPISSGKDLEQQRAPGSRQIESLGINPLGDLRRRGEARLLVEPAPHPPGSRVRLAQPAVELLEVLKPPGARSDGAGLLPRGVQRSLPAPAAERSWAQGHLYSALSESGCGDNTASSFSGSFADALLPTRSRDPGSHAGPI